MSSNGERPRTEARKGLWRGNPALVDMLGLCPLLGVSTSVVNGLGLGLATLAVLVSSNLLVSLSRHTIVEAIRLPLFVMLIAALTTSVELLIKAFAYPLYTTIGLFIPLIVTNCMILARAELFASRHGPIVAVIDGVSRGCGFALVLIVLGAIRELLGTGTLLAHLDTLFGASVRDWRITLWSGDNRLLLALLPPGAFIVTGLLIALKNALASSTVTAPVAGRVQN